MDSKYVKQYYLKKVNEMFVMAYKIYIYIYIGTYSQNLMNISIINDVLLKPG